MTVETDTIESLCAELAEARRQRDEARALTEQLKLEAQGWAGEAKCHKSSLHKAYQAVSGATGEPGNWHGAVPIVDALTATRAENERLRAALGKVEKSLRARGVCERGGFDPSTGVFECARENRGDCNCFEFDEAADEVAKIALAPPLP